MRGHRQHVVWFGTPTASSNDCVCCFQGKIGTQSSGSSKNVLAKIWHFKNLSYLEILCAPFSTRCSWLTRSCLRSSKNSSPCTCKDLTLQKLLCSILNKIFVLQRRCNNYKPVQYSVTRSVISKTILLEQDRETPQINSNENILKLFW